MPWVQQSDEMHTCLYGRLELVVEEIDEGVFEWRVEGGTDEHLATGKCDSINAGKALALVVAEHIASASAALR